MAPSSPDASIVNSTSKLLADLDLNANHPLLMQDMEDMDIDMVMEVPDTPDRLAASQNGNGGEEIGEIVKSPVVLNSRMPNLVDKGVYNRIRNHDKLSTENVNNGRLSCCSGDNSFLNEIKQNSGPVVSLHDSPSVSMNADIFRKMMTEKVSSGDQTMEHVSSSNNRVKLDNDSPIIVDVLASDEKNRNRNKGKMTDLISTEKMPSRTSNSASSRNLRKKLMLHGNTIADLGDAGYLGVSHGKGIDLSHDTKKMSEKLMSRSLQSTTSPRINGQKRLVRNGLISPSNIARATHTVQSHDANSMDGNKGNAGELMFKCEIPLSQAHNVGPKSEGNDDRAKGKGVMDEFTLAEYEMEPNIIHRIKGKGAMTAFTPTKEHGIEPDTIDRKKDKGALEGFSSVKEYEIGPNIINRTKGKGFMEEVVPAEDNETKTIQLSSRSSLNPTEEANGIGDAFNHLKEVGVWRSARNRSKKMTSALSDEVEYLPRGKNSVDHLLNRNRVESEDNMKGVNFGSESENHERRDPFSYPIQASSSSRPHLDQRNRREVGRMKLTKRQRKRPSTHPNYGECSSSAFDNSEVTYRWSSRGSSDVRSSRSRNTRSHGISSTVIDVDEFSPEALVRSHNTSQMLNDESDDQARQVEADEILARELQEQFYNELEGISRGEIDANIAWTLQQEENAQRASFRRRPRVDTRDASMSHLYRQYPSQYFRSSLVRSANRARGHSSTRMAQLRNSFLSQSPALSSSEGIQFPPNMDIEMRMHILEALEAAVSDNDGMTMTSNIFQVQRDFNENDYEMLLALDEFNHQSGASLDQINGLPQSTVQTDNFEEACAICLETPTIGDTIRHLPCLHKFHKDCIDPWLRRKTSCPVCKSCIT